MLIVSRAMGSRPRGVIFTARRAVFICGETAVIVPCRMVPGEWGVSMWLESWWGGDVLGWKYRF